MTAQNGENKASAGGIRLWFASFLVVGSLLVFFGGAPLIPVLGGGILALLITWIKKTHAGKN